MEYLGAAGTMSSSRSALTQSHISRQSTQIRSIESQFAKLSNLSAAQGPLLDISLHKSADRHIMR